MLRLALKHEKDEVSHSAVKQARELNIDYETEFAGEMKNTGNAQKLKRMLRKRETSLSILPGSQNRYMVSTHFETKKLIWIYMTPISG